MAISDAQFRLGVIAGGIVLALGISSVRFCGNVSLPPKPLPHHEPTGTGNQLMTKTASSPAVYRDFLSRDAATAGVRAPALDEMSRKLVFRADESRHVLEVGQPAISVAGLTLQAVRSGDAIALVIENTTASDLGYMVATAPTPNISGCSAARPLAFNAMVIAKGQRETRVECAWRSGMAIAVTRVETVELSALSAWYLEQVPPALVGIEDRIGRGHRARQNSERCTPMMGQALRTGVERGEIGWRDLVDFYARHRCQTYQFPLGYRAFTADGQHALPVSSAGM